MKFCHLLWLLQPTSLKRFKNFPPETHFCSHRNGKPSLDLNDLNRRSDSQRAALALSLPADRAINPLGGQRWPQGSAGSGATGKRGRVGKKVPP